VNFLAGEVDQIDLEQKRVIVSHGFDNHPHTLEFDFLVFGLGSITNTYGLPGVQEHALTMKSLRDAMQVRNHLIAHLEEADSDCCGELESLLTFVVAGGGFAGVETVAAINDFVRRALRAYPHLSEDMVRVILIHSGPVILPELEESLGIYAQKILGGRKVEIHLTTRIESFSGRAVRFDGTMIPTNTLVWTAGTSPNPLLETIPCAKEGGRLLVTEFLELQGWPGVWALGDCSAIPNRLTGKFHPPTAQHALRQGKIAAHNIIASMRGTAKKRFGLFDHSAARNDRPADRRSQHPGR
jgi:NADH dehydrogenase